MCHTENQQGNVQVSLMYVYPFYPWTGHKFVRTKTGMTDRVQNSSTGIVWHHYKFQHWILHVSTLNISSFKASSCFRVSLYRWMVPVPGSSNPSNSDRRSCSLRFSSCTLAFSSWSTVTYKNNYFTYIISIVYYFKFQDPKN